MPGPKDEYESVSLSFFVFSRGKSHLQKGFELNEAPLFSIPMVYFIV